MEDEQALIKRLEQGPQGLTFIGALREILVGKAEFVDKNVYLQRLKICEICEYKIQRLNMCGICKCVLPTKARFVHATCPKNKWPT